MTTPDADCPLCRQDGGALLWRGDRLRVIEVDDADYPGFTRVVWNAHVPEMTALAESDRERVMRAVYAVEQAQRDVLNPDKINLAALGNMVPHLHWHVIPRWRGDRHFPDAIWAAPRVAADAQGAAWHAYQARVRALLPAYRDRVVAAMSALT